MSKARGITTSEGESIRKNLRYYNGKLYWLVNKTSNARRGSEAGSIDNGKSGNGYSRVRVDGRSYRAHRVIWYLWYGVWPSVDLEIDHIDGNKLNNTINNLRIVDGITNIVNPSTCKPGITGVVNIHIDKDRKYKSYVVDIIRGGRCYRKKGFKHLSDACMYKHITLATL